MSDAAETGTFCDCHIHLFDRDAPARVDAYTPPPKGLADYLEEAMTARIGRAVVVQASVDGTDNSRLVQALRTAEGIELRGVAMIDAETQGLENMAAAGVRAARIQDRTRLGRNDLALLPALARRAAEVDWHIELNTEPERFAALATLLDDLPAGQRLVLDHIGHVDPQREEDLDALCRLLDTGRIWVKLAPTRVSRRIGTYEDLAQIVYRLAGQYTECCIWGSDWPHVMTEPPLPTIAPMLDFLSQVLSGAQLEACLSSNPERLYAFTMIAQSTSNT